MYFMYEGACACVYRVSDEDKWLLPEGFRTFPFKFLRQAIHLKKYTPFKLIYIFQCAQKHKSNEFKFHVYASSIGNKWMVKSSMMLRSISDITFLTCFLTLIFVQNTGYYISLEASSYQLFLGFFRVSFLSITSTQGLQKELWTK